MLIRAKKTDIFEFGAIGTWEYLSFSGSSTFPLFRSDSFSPPILVSEYFFRHSYPPPIRISTPSSRKKISEVREGVIFHGGHITRPCWGCSIWELQSCYFLRKTSLTLLSPALRGYHSFWKVVHLLFPSMKLYGQNSWIHFGIILKR